MKRLLFISLLTVSPLLGWVESVEFPWNTFPRQLWERELAWLKNIGVKHVSLPPAKTPAEIVDLVKLLRALQLEADLEGPIPAELEPYSKTHGGPLIAALPAPVARISALHPKALLESRKHLEAGSASLLWTDLEDTLRPDGYRAGLINFAGDEKSPALAIRRNAQLMHFWGASFVTLKLVKTPLGNLPGIQVKQYLEPKGLSLAAVTNPAAKPYAGDLKVYYPPSKHILSIPKVTVPAGASLWLPVNVPIGSSTLCKACSAFAATDHLVYATAELTAMEYENGILAMEFSAPEAAEAVLQLTRQPSGPYVAGGKPIEFDWDPHTQRVRLVIPKGKGIGDRVRVGIAIEPPDSTAFFDLTRVLVIGEHNLLTSQYSSEEIAKRSRLVVPQGFTVTSKVKSPMETVFDIYVPETAVHGDHVEISIEGDGVQLSHAKPQLLRPSSVRFPDAIGVRLAPASTLAVFPATIPFNARSGRDVSVVIRNNAPEIRNFDIRLEAEGLEFSPASLQVAVGASTQREVQFRVFPTKAEPGLHAGFAILSGTTYVKEAVRFLVVPPSMDLAWESGPFRFLESQKFRASFLGENWIEYVDKDKNENRLKVPLPFSSQPQTLADLEGRLPK